MNYFIDKIYLIISSLSFLILLVIGGLFFHNIIPNIHFGFFVISMIYILSFSWIIISDNLKNKKGIDFIIGIALMIFLEILTISLLFLIIIKFNIKWPERGGSFYALAFFFPIGMLNWLIFTEIYKILLKKHRKYKNANKEK